MKARLIFFVCCFSLFLLGVWFLHIGGEYYFPGAHKEPHPWISSSIAMYGGLLLLLPQLPVALVGEFLRSNTVFPLAPELSRGELLPLYSFFSAVLYTMLLPRAPIKKDNTGVPPAA